MHASLQQPVARTTATPARPAAGQKGVTVGATISAAVGTGAMATQLTDLAAKFPVDGPLGVKPRSGYLTGFVGKLQRDPKAGVLDIVGWAPYDLTAKGAAGTREQQAANKEKMSSMSMAQKARVVQGLIAGLRSMAAGLRP